MNPSISNSNETLPNLNIKVRSSNCNIFVLNDIYVSREIYKSESVTIS